jgi:ACS family glucarate transporter-like MFS transporter
MSDPFANAKVSPATESPTRVRYAILTFATLMAILLYLDRYCISFTQGHIQRELGLTNNEKSWVLAVFYLSYALGQLPSGWLSDRYGSRLMLTFYILVWSLMTGLMGVAGSFLIVIAIQLGLGLAQAGGYPTGALIVSKWMPADQRGMGSGIVSVGGRLGGVLAPVLTAYLLWAFAPAHSTDSGSAWRATFLVYGGTGLLFAVAFWFMVRDKPGLHPGCNAAEIKLIGGRADTAVTAARAGAIPMRYLLKSRSMWFCSVQQFFTNFGWVFIVRYLPAFLDDRGISDKQRGWMSALPIAVGIVGMLCGGWLTDSMTRGMGKFWGRCLPMSLTRFLAMFAYIACILFDSPWPVTLALGMAAIATDLGTPAAWAYAQDVGSRYVGSALGWANMWGNLGAFAMPIVLTWLIDNQKLLFPSLAVQITNWQIMFIGCAVAFLISGLAGLGVDARIPLIPAEAELPQ